MNYPDDGQSPARPAASPDRLDALVVMCPPWDISQPPINLAYLTSYARAHGANVMAWDLNIKLHKVARTPELRALWEPMIQNDSSDQEVADQFFQKADGIIRGFIRRIVALGTPVVGFSVHNRNVHFTTQLAETLRSAAPDLKIIFGGPEVSISYALGQLSELNADAYVIGEGEQTLVDALTALRETGELTPVPGMVLAGAEPGSLEPRAEIRDLDELPFPSWEDFDLDWYDRPQVDPSVPFLLSRGCTGKCRFCMDHVISGRHRIRSPENAVAEIEQIIERHDIRHFHFNDLICNGSPRKLRQFAELVVEKGLDIGYWSYAVVRRGLDRAFFSALKRSGCSSLMFGLESGCTATLKRMNKYYTAEEAEQVLAACSASGISTGINIIVGFPGETEEEHKETLEFLKRNQRSIDRVVNLGTCLISPGTDLHQRPEEYGILHDAEQDTWYTEDGTNNIDVRNRRLSEVEQTLSELGIPRIIVNRERGLSSFTVGQGDEAEQRTVEQPVRLYDVQFLDVAEEECNEFATGEYMSVVMRFRVVEPLMDPVLRLQFFNDQNDLGRNLFVFGTNTDRALMRLGKVEPGKLEARLNIYELGLLPGKYKVTLGIWPSVDATVAHDVRHGFTIFKVAGDLDPREARVALPIRLDEMAQVGEAPPEGQPAVHGMSLHDTHGLEMEAFLTGDSLRVRMDCDVPEGELLDLQLLLEQDGLTLARNIPAADPMPAGRQMVDVLIEDLPLLGGRYVLAAELVIKSTGEPVARREELLRVSNGGAVGAGLVRLPSAWEVSAVRFTGQ